MSYNDVQEIEAKTGKNHVTGNYSFGKEETSN